MNESKAPAAARVQAATALMNRGWGMPKQEIELDGAEDMFARLFAMIDGSSRSLPQANGHDKPNGAANGHSQSSD